MGERKREMVVVGRRRKWMTGSRGEWLGRKGWLGSWGGREEVVREEG